MIRYMVWCSFEMFAFPRIDPNTLSDLSLTPYPICLKIGTVAYCLSKKYFRIFQNFKFFCHPTVDQVLYILAVCCYSQIKYQVLNMN